jgi:hypothetical protein
VDDLVSKYYEHGVGAEGEEDGDGDSEYLGDDAGVYVYDTTDDGRIGGGGGSQDGTSDVYYDDRRDMDDDRSGGGGGGEGEEDGNYGDYEVDVDEEATYEDGRTGGGGGGGGGGSYYVDDEAYADGGGGGGRGRFGLSPTPLSMHCSWRQPGLHWYGQLTNEPLNHV